jgi:hypothetical protein
MGAPERSVRQLDEHVGVARPFQRAIAGEVATTELTADLIDRDVEPSSQEIIPVATHRFRATQTE